MARPVKIRTGQTYRRDVDGLTRLRTAMKLDSSIPKPLLKKACAQIDGLTDTILEILRAVDAPPSK